jgi:two-component sensor histidine kinase
LNAELQHRVKNTLMVVQAIAAQTAKSSANLQGFREVFEDRIQALSQAHNILSKTDWTALTLSEVVGEALNPFDRIRIKAAETECKIAAAACVPLVLVLHELATNASKYGALSAPEGWVEVNWRLSSHAPQEAAIEWREHGGPPVTPPTRRGFGSRLLSGMRGIGSIQAHFDPEGVRCQIRMPLATRE